MQDVRHQHRRQSSAAELAQGLRP